MSSGQRSNLVNFKKFLRTNNKNQLGQSAVNDDEDDNADVIEYVKKQAGIKARSKQRIKKALRKLSIANALLGSNSSNSGKISMQGQVAIIGTAVRGQDSKLYSTIKASKAILDRLKLGSDILEEEDDEDIEDSATHNRTSSETLDVPHNIVLGDSETRTDRMNWLEEESDALRRSLESIKM